MHVVNYLNTAFHAAAHQENCFALGVFSYVDCFQYSVLFSGLFSFTPTLGYKDNYVDSQLRRYLIQ